MLVHAQVPRPEADSRHITGQRGVEAHQGGQGRAGALAQTWGQGKRGSEMSTNPTTPDGWPAVKQMHLNAAAAELERQHAEIEALKAERARSGLAHRKAVQEAVREALQEARKACENLPAPDSCTGVERSLWDVATMACAEAVGKVGAT